MPRQALIIYLPFTSSRTTCLACIFAAIVSPPPLKGLLRLDFQSPTRLAVRTVMEQEDAPANKAAAGLRMHLCDTLNGDIQNVVEMVLERGDALFKGRLDWLEHLWVKVKGLSPTTDLVSVRWKGHVDGTVDVRHRRILQRQ